MGSVVQHIYIKNVATFFFWVAKEAKHL